MKKQIHFLSLLAIGGLIMAQLVGCEKAGDSVKGAVDKAEKAAGKATDEAGDMAKKMGDAAMDAAEKSGAALSNLGEKAMGFLEPLKGEFAKLEGLVSEPSKLKETASDLIKKLDTDMSGFKLPQAVTDALAMAKEKLIALRDYITDDADPAELKKKVEGVMESVKTALGMSKG
jgi:hypothetical protein